ncbi:MAG TPA: ABC transporter permease [Candidatus Sulfotelmatobacter sp.]|nr:ABC transporter permease [Candidatus Sulfotelmatobacter sp.]
MAAITPNQLRGPATTEAVRPAYRPVRPGPVATLRSTVREIVTHRRLIGYLVRADLKKRGADTFLGNVWWFLDPLLTMLVYVILVSVILQSTQEAYPLFIFCAILPWKWFSASVADAVTCVTTKEKVIKQVRFPKVVLPVAATVGGLVSFVFGLVPLGAMLIILFPNHISAMILLLPVVAAVQFVLTFAICLLAAAITVFYRDIGNLAGHLLRIWFYLSPALYSSQRIQSIATNHPQLYSIYTLNPFAGLFESYRNLIYYGQPPEWGLLGIVLVEASILVVLSVIVFRRLEPSFAKVL